MKAPNVTEGEWLFSKTGSQMESYSQSHGVVMRTATGWILVAGCFSDIPGGETSAAANAQMLAASKKLAEALNESNELLNRIASGQDWGAIEEYIQDNVEALLAAGYTEE